jgi:hypothetical protein
VAQKVRPSTGCRPEMEVVEAIVTGEQHQATPAQILDNVTATDGNGDSRGLVFTFFEELADPIRKLAQTAWAARGKLGRDVKSYTLLVVSMVFSLPGRVSKVVSNPKLHQLLSEEEDPPALAAVLCGCSGALCLGSSGAVIGTTVGGAVGLAVGSVPAIFTFGLSLPIGALIGGVCGFCTGSAVGGSAGLGAGAASGMTVAYLRADIKYVTLSIASRIYDVYDVLVVRPVTVVRTTGKRVGDKVTEGKDFTVAKAHAVGSVAKDVAADPAVRTSALGAGAGAAALGTAGAATGALVGGTAGALAGLVPAIFTFGLSIPIGAVVGGSAGLCTGGTVGTTVGFTGGGLAGYAGYTYRGAPTKLYKLAVGTLRQRSKDAAAVE